MTDLALRLTSTYENRAVLMPATPDKDDQSRLGFYLEWLELTKRSWHQPDLAAYRDYLLHERKRPKGLKSELKPARLSATSAQAHLATIRGRYTTLLRDNSLREKLYDLTPYEAGPADKKALVDELLTRLQNATHPSTAVIPTIVKQDEEDAVHLRLKPHEVRELLRQPGIRGLRGLRDTSIIALLVCTGIREAELVMLDINDLRQRLGGELAIRVRDGKGGKQRLIPYGPLDWCLLYVERWLELAKIQTGAVFRGFYKGNKNVRKTRITERSVNLILNSYLITVDGQLRDVKPHDLRRTYARNAYEQGMDLERIRQNLGHESIQTTLTYIGALSVEQRRPPAMFRPPHRLADLQKQWSPSELDTRNKSKNSIDSE
jgi:site-specific recombinase XerD